MISVSVPSPPRSLPCRHPSRYSVLPMFLIVSKRSLVWCYIQLGRTVFITVYLKYIKYTLKYKSFLPSDFALPEDHKTSGIHPSPSVRKLEGAQYIVRFGVALSKSQSIADNSASQSKRTNGICRLLLCVDKAFCLGV